MAGDDEIILLSYEEAVALLPDGDRIHTFLDSGIALIGADWDRADILSLLERTERREVTGPAAQSYGHGLAATREDGTPVFIKTRPAPFDRDALLNWSPGRDEPQTAEGAAFPPRTFAPGFDIEADVHNPGAES
jgi:hypothetical protein